MVNQTYLLTATHPSLRHVAALIAGVVETIWFAWTRKAG
jgi:hypothetical protein